MPQLSLVTVTWTWLESCTDEAGTTRHLRAQERTRDAAQTLCGRVVAFRHRGQLSQLTACQGCAAEAAKLREQEIQPVDVAPTPVRRELHLVRAAL